MKREILDVLQDREINIQMFFEALPTSVQAHAKKVADMTVQLVNCMVEAGWEDAVPLTSSQEIYKAVLFHDIGQSLIPTELLTKSEDLTGPERRVIERHTMYGGQLLDKYRKCHQNTQEDHIWKAAAETAVSHHERWDGKGYPHGLKANATPILSRIVAIADAYDAITRGANYRMPLPPEYAALEIVANAGRQFDPQLTELFRAQYFLLAVEDSYRAKNVSQEERR